MNNIIQLSFNFDCVENNLELEKIKEPLVRLVYVNANYMNKPVYLASHEELDAINAALNSAKELKWNVN